MLKTDRILTLNVGANTLSMGVFYPVKGGGVELVQYAVQALDPEVAAGDERNAYITGTLREMMMEYGIAPGPVLISVPGQSVFSRFVKLPSVSKEKISQIVQYEAQQNVPFPINEVVWDYQLIGGVEGEIDVMLAAIKAEIIEDLTDAVSEAGLDPDLVDVSPMSLYNAVRYNYSELPSCTLLVDIGARSTDLLFIEEGRVFSRSIPVGGNTITQQIMREFDLSFEDAEQMKRTQAFVSFGGAYESGSEVTEKLSKSVRSVMNRMHAEITRSINFYKTQQAGSQPGMVLLTGGSSTIPYTNDFLKEKLKVEVDYLNPFLNVAVNEAIDAVEIGNHAHMLGEVVGLALRRILTCPIEINLLPSKVVEEKEFRKKQPLFLAAAFGLVLILMVWCAYFFQLAQLGQERLDKMRGRVREIEVVKANMDRIEHDIDDVRLKIDKVQNVIQKRTQWQRVLDEIHQLLPEGMWITGIQPVLDEEAKGMNGRPTVSVLNLTGMAYLDVHNPTDIRTLRDTLRASDRFTEDTNIQKFPSPRSEDAVMEFQLQVTLAEPLET